MDPVIWSIIESEAHVAGVEALLAAAVAMTESSWDPAATRFEQGWKYFYQVEMMAIVSQSPVDQERRDQATSWGLMQVMGAVARELGYRGKLADLKMLPEAGAALGCQKLAALLKQWPLEADAVAAYNAGTPRRIESGPQAGNYENQRYVDTVFNHLSDLRAQLRPD